VYSPTDQILNHKEEAFCLGVLLGGAPVTIKSFLYCASKA